ncbi:MAG: hypothetical protein AAF988_06365, partial [Pseudomonadota bacterium]
MKWIPVISFLLFLLSSSTLLAQDNRKSSSSEDVALLFYKSGEQIPNFTNWVKRTLHYQEQPLAKRENYLKRQRESLIKRYQDIDLKTSYIT